MKKIVLKTPVSVGSLTVTELDFRRPKVKDFDGIELKIGDGGMAVDLTSLKKLAGRLCGQTDLVMGEIDIGDLSEVIAVVMGFIFPGPETGAKL
jgi:hypothetical protein